MHKLIEMEAIERLYDIYYHFSTLTQYINVKSILIIANSSFTNAHMMAINFHLTIFEIFLLLSNALSVCTSVLFIVS